MLEEAKLIDLKKGILEYATLVESMVEKSITGLKNKDTGVLNQVVKEDEPKANDFEIELDEKCISLIAQHQPAGRALRTIFMASSIDINLERMADHAVNICESALYLIERPQVKPLIDTPKMGEIVIGMIKDSIRSFVYEDSDLAKNVCERDNLVDDLRDRILRELITIMTSDSSTIERSLHLLRISNNLERIADLSTNICEDVIYMVKGKIIKHHRDE
jgi:phosphate transport system protein